MDNDVRVGLAILARAARTFADVIDDNLAATDVPTNPDPVKPPIVTDPTIHDGWSQRPSPSDADVIPLQRGSEFGRLTVPTGP